jgi:hypothetical protein
MLVGEIRSDEVVRLLLVRCIDLLVFFHCIDRKIRPLSYTRAEIHGRTDKGTNIKQDDLIGV